MRKNNETPFSVSIIINMHIVNMHIVSSIWLKFILVQILRFEM